MWESVFPAILRNHPWFWPIAWISSAISTILIALPSFYFLIKWLKIYKAMFLIAILGLFALIFEAQSIVTGFPYSHFHYGNMHGYLIFDLVPWYLPFAYVPLVLGCMTITWHLTKNIFVRIILSAILLTLLDIVFDPVATKLGLWLWSNPSLENYYGVPLLNFFGWFISGIIASSIGFFVVNKSGKPPWLISSSFFIYLFLSTIGSIIFGFYLSLIFALLIICLAIFSHNKSLQSI